MRKKNFLEKAEVRFLSPLTLPLNTGSCTDEGPDGAESPGASHERPYSSWGLVCRVSVGGERT